MAAAMLTARRAAPIIPTQSAPDRYVPAVAPECRACHSGRMYRSIVPKATAVPAVLCLLVSGLFAQDIPKLAVFGGRPPGKGLWKMELVDSSNKEMLKHAKMASGMGVCMDAAAEMGDQMKQNSSNPREKCDVKVLKNTASAAEVQVSCPNGTKSHAVITAESKDSYLTTSTLTGKDGKVTTIKARYRYAGACKSNSVLQMDSSSPQCAQIKAQLASMDPAAACAHAAGADKAACVEQMKAATAQMKKMCP